LFKVNQFLPKK